MSIAPVDLCSRELQPRQDQAHLLRYDRNLLVSSDGTIEVVQRL